MAKECLKEPFGTPYVKVCSMEAAKEGFAKTEPSIRGTFCVRTAGQIKGSGRIAVNATNPKDLYYKF